MGTSPLLYLCSLVGAKYSSMGLFTFQYFSLTSSREKEPFRTWNGIQQFNCNQVQVKADGSEVTISVTVRALL